MKKVKLIFVATAILLSVGGAFATRAHMDCRFAQQYIQVGSGYEPVGTEGINYTCEYQPASTCTWVQVGSNYQACQTGVYIFIQ